MPTYEYVCDACGKQWELEQRISEDPVKKCPACGKLKARRQISGGNFILKGGGWYADLYSGPSNAKGAKGEAAKDGGSKDATGASTGDGAKGGASASSGSGAGASSGSSSSASDGGGKGKKASAAG
jgi:putative FmdB family regulatory protein